MRAAWSAHFCTNYAGDDGFVHRLRYEFRRFNYFGDTTWIRGRISQARIDDVLGPLIEIEFWGENQRGSENLRGSATILLPSRVHGEVQLPKPPAMPEFRS